MAKAKKPKKNRKPARSKRLRKAGPSRGRFVSTVIGIDKREPRMPTLEEQLAEHMRDAPIEKAGDAYWQAYRLEWIRKRNQLQDAIRQRDAKRVVDDTVEIAADDPDDLKKVRKNLARAKQSEAWRHNKLTPMQRDAAHEMTLAWQSRTVGLGPSRSKYGAVGGGAMPESYKLDKEWKDWLAAAVDRRIMIGPVIDCLTEPMTLPEIERKHRMRRGQAMDQFISALDLWCELRGWVRAPRMQAGPHLLPEGVGTRA